VGERPQLLNCQNPRLVIEVQRELVRVRTQPKRVDLVLTLVVDPGLDDLRRENVALEEEGVVALEGLERLVERARRLRHILELLGSERIDVLVERLAGSILFWIPSRPAISMTENARYGLAVGSGQRNSSRFDFGDALPIGMRIDAERLRDEYARFTGAS